MFDVFHNFKGARLLTLSSEFCLVFLRKLGFKISRFFTYSWVGLLSITLRTEYLVYKYHFYLGNIPLHVNYACVSLALCACFGGPHISLSKQKGWGTAMEH